MSDRIGVLYGVLWTHVVAMVLMVLLGFDGLLRLLLEQFAFALGLLTTQGANGPERLLLVMHGIGFVALTTFLLLWRREDPRAAWALPAAAVSQLFLAPVGLVVAASLFWLRRQDDWLLSSFGVAGERRTRIVLTWTIGCAATALAALPAFLMLGANPLLWFGLMLLAPTPLAGALWLLMRHEVEFETILPPLPDSPVGP